jgi:hypothetical protein
MKTNIRLTCGPSVPERAATTAAVLGLEII